MLDKIYIVNNEARTLHVGGGNAGCLGCLQPGVPDILATNIEVKVILNAKYYQKELQMQSKPEPYQHTE